VDSGTRLRIANDKTDSSDPYVLLGGWGGAEGRGFAPKKTKTLKRTTDPVFDEDLVYPGINVDDLAECKVCV
jgi:hypothetical protein